MITPFEVEVEELDAEVCVLCIGGELDQAAAPQLDERLAAILDAPDKRLVIDLSDCTFIDSTGLSVLVRARSRMLANGGRFELCCAEGQVERLLEVTGLRNAFGVPSTREAAVAALDGDRPDQAAG